MLRLDPTWCSANHGVQTQHFSCISRSLDLVVFRSCQFCELYPLKTEKGALWAYYASSLQQLYVVSGRFVRSSWCIQSVGWAVCILTSSVQLSSSTGFLILQELQQQQVQQPQQQHICPRRSASQLRWESSSDWEISDDNVCQQESSSTPS